MFRRAILLIAATLVFPAAAQADVLSNTGDGIYAAMTAQADGAFRATWVEGSTVRESVDLGPARDVIRLTARDRFPFGAADAHGGVVVAFQRKGPPYRRVYFAIRRADGKLTPARKLSPAGHTAEVPAIAGDAAGNALACWRRYDGSVWQAQCAIRKAGANEFGPAVTLPGGADKDRFAPQPAVGANGRLAVVYETQTRVLAAIGSVDGGLAGGRPIGTHSLNYANASVAVAGDGSAMVVWTTVDGQHHDIQAVRLAPDGTSAPPQQVGAPGGVQPAELAPPALAALSDGSFLGAWASGKDMLAATAPAAAGFGAPTRVGAVEDFSWPARIAAGPGATATLAWTLEAPIGHPSTVQLARFANATWSAPATISPANGRALAPYPALNFSGTSAVAWIDSREGGAMGDVDAMIVR